MKLALAAVLALPLMACSPSTTSQAALCTGTKADRKAHAAALIEDGGPRSSATGAAVLSKFQRGCGE